MRLLPRNQAFFDEFDRHAALIVTASRELREMVSGGGGSAVDAAARIRRLEEDGDAIVQRVARGLRATFITPLDRDDTHHLASRLDQVLDAIEAAAYRLALYRLPLPHPQLTSLAEQVWKASQTVRQVIEELRHRSHHDRALEACVRLNEIENDAENLLRAALAHLFAREKDPIMLIKWKESFELLEDTTHRCEDLADTVDDILLSS
jgi:uncharacterized protein Yka (UPF0111/DUF47 family)